MKEAKFDGLRRTGQTFPTDKELLSPSRQHPGQLRYNYVGLRGNLTKHRQRHFYIIFSRLHYLNKSLLFIHKLSSLLV